MADDLRHRYAAAILAGLAQTGPTPSDYDLADAVMAVRDEELEQLRYERRLLGAARMVLDLVAAGDSSRWEQARRGAEDIAQRIVDEIGHPVTDEPALGPALRERAETAEPAIARVRSLAEQLEAEAEQGLKTSVLDSQRAAWSAQVHVTGLFLAALDDTPEA